MSRSMINVRNMRGVAAGLSVFGVLSLGFGSYKALNQSYSLSLDAQEALGEVVNAEGKFSQTLSGMPKFWHEGSRSKQSLEEIARNFQEGAKQASALNELYNSPRIIKARAESGQIESRDLITHSALGLGVTLFLVGALGYVMLGAYEKMNEQARKDTEKKSQSPPN